MLKKNIPIFISVQSNVSYGFVGNKVAALVLQCLKNEVITIDTAHYSHHPGHRFSTGNIEPSCNVLKTLEALKEFGALGLCDGILSGYLGSPDIARITKNLVKEMRLSSSHIPYLCDPVLGDVGKGIYVNPDLCDFFKQELLPLATITTPNHFEAELLTGIAIKNIRDASQAAAVLHTIGPPIVIITSLLCNEIGPSKIGTLLSYQGKIFLTKTDLLVSSFAFGGCGDLFSALFLSCFYTSKNPTHSLERAVASTYSIIELTTLLQAKELQLVQGQKYLTNPSIVTKAINHKQKLHANDANKEEETT